MNLDHLTSLTDDGEHWLVGHRKHGTFRIPKDALRDDQTAALKEHARALAMAAVEQEGTDAAGVQHKEAAGTVLPDGTKETPDAKAALEETLGGPKAPLIWRDAATDQPILQGAAMGPPISAAPPLEGVPDSIAAPDGVPPPGIAAPAPAAPQETPADQAAIDKAIGTVDQAASRTAGAVRAPTAAKPKAAAPATGAAADYQRATDDELKAQQIQAEEAQKRAALDAESQKTYADEIAAAETERKLSLAHASAQVDRYDRLIQTGEWSPDEYWSKPGNTHWLSTLAVIFGTIGQKLNGGENTALQIIDHALERDHTTFRENLARNEREREHYRQQGLDADTVALARRSAAAAILSAAIGQHAATVSDPEAKAKLLGLQAATRQKAVMAGETIANNEASRKIQAAQLGLQQRQFALELSREPAAQALRQQELEKGRLQIDATKKQAAAQDAYQAAVKAGGGDPDKLLALKRDMIKADPEALASHSVRETVEVPVLGPDGKPAMDTKGQPLTTLQRKVRVALDDKESVKKAREAFAGSKEQLSKLKALEQFHRQHPIGSWTPDDSQEAGNLTKDFALSFNKEQEGNNRLNDVELKLIESMVANPSGVWGSLAGKTDASFRTLRHAIDQKRAAIREAYTFPEAGD